MVDIVWKKESPVKADVMDAQELSYSDGQFTHVYARLGLHLTADPDKAAREVYRVLKPGGTAIFTSPTRPAWIDLFQDAQQKVAPHTVLWKGPMSEEWYTEKKLHDVLTAGGFRNIKISKMKTNHSVSMIRGFVDGMRGQLAKSITEGWTEEAKQQFEVAIEWRTQERRLKE